MYKPSSHYTLEPHADLANDENGYIPIETIVERVYGKTYSSLRGCQRDYENLPNDSVALYALESDDAYAQALIDFDQPGVHLGFDMIHRESLFKEDMTQLEYWLSFSVSDDHEKVTVHAYEDAPWDLENAVFARQHDADLAFTPSLEGILADLIRRGELPRGNYLFRHWW